MVVVLIAVVIGAQVAYDKFLTWDNIRNLLSQNAPLAIVAVGMTIVILSGAFDLSVGSVLAAGSTVYAMYAKEGHSLWLAALIAILVGCVCGVLNGVVVTKLKVTPFITTLASAAIVTGLTYVWSDSRPITVRVPGFGDLARKTFLDVSWSVWLTVGIFVVGGVLVGRTVFGRYIYAVGGNLEAARLAGIPTDRIRLAAFVAVSVSAAIGGIVLASRLGVGSADQGANVTLDSIAIVVIGGTSLFGGEGAVWRTAVGLLILATLNNLLSSLALESAVQNVVKGSVLLLAVILDSYTRRRRAL
ncbi:ABC transporter permease [Amycolatopsis sp. RM579]|uniref:ABC transporter permease n=2 Tax=Amycolatopsis pithecellobii TaxID=664692 RepID=A0A6N7YSQ1_9PSEU|nr:ABC transporter permease [Amycolatopsis pithecellobii]